jgi:hypothetical protein
LWYGRADLARGFSRQHGLNHLRPCGTAITPQDQATDFPIAITSLKAWHQDDHYLAGLPSCVPPSLKRPYAVPEY